MASGLSGERIEKILLHNIYNEIFLNALINPPIGIAVSALAYHVGGPGSIPGSDYFTFFSITKNYLP